MTVAAVRCAGAPAGAGNHWKGRCRNLGCASGCGWLAGTAEVIAGRTSVASGFGFSVMVPDGPLSETCCGEMLSTRQSFSASPSDRITDFAPFTAKIAMRRSGSITMPLSLTSDSWSLPALSAGTASGARCVAPGSAISRACAAVSVAGGLRSNDVLSRLVKPRPTRTRAIDTTHPARNKAGNRVIMTAR